MKGFVTVEPLTGIFFALKAMHHFYTAAWDAFFVILIILIANMKYFTRKIGYFYFFEYVKGFSSSPALLLELQKTKHITASFTWNQTIFACWV